MSRPVTVYCENQTCRTCRRHQTRRAAASHTNWRETTEAQALELGHRAWRWLESIYVDGWTPLVEVSYETYLAGLENPGNPPSRDEVHRRMVNAPIHEDHEEWECPDAALCIKNPRKETWWRLEPNSTGATTTATPT